MAFEGLAEKLSGVFKKMRGKGKLKEGDVKEAMREVRMALLEADVNYKVVKDFVASVTEKAMGNEVMESLTPAQMVIKIVHEELTALMGGENVRLNMQSRPPTIVMLCGLQGSGKTTHAAKLAKYFKAQNKRPLLVACDVYRPAAIQQLQVVGEKAGIPVFERGQGDPVDIARQAVAHGKDHGNDLIILDTAGRLHIDEVLMEELKSLKAQISPHEILLVVDAMVGQDAVNVAKTFHEALTLDGVILTKLDGDARGGAALSIRSVTGCPVKFAGVGEKLGDIEPFHPDRMASRILGMGDILTLIDKAQTDFDEKKAREMAKKLQKKGIDFNDLLDQMQQLEKMGSLASVVNMIPGLSGKIGDAEALRGEKEMRKMKAIIMSMTPKERAKPSLINPSRKRRIAAGSATQVSDVNRLLRHMEMMQKMLKQKPSKGGKLKNPFAGLL